MQDGETGKVACDHYNRYVDAVKLMARLGVDAYRFSIAWPRGIPEGHGRVNQAGLDFYSRLVNERFSWGIEPFVTLYHWDLPQSLQGKGRWLNRDSVKWFKEFTITAANHLSDRVKFWISLNEPWVVSYLGHMWGRYAPGIKDPTTAIQVSHNLLISHGDAVSVLRDISEDVQVGIALNLTLSYLATRSDKDQQAASRIDGFWNRRYFVQGLMMGANK